LYDVSVLHNGIRIVTETVPHVRSVSVGLWIKAGSRSESPDKRGVSHLIEHMLFKGTESRTAKRIAEEVDGIGAQLNAYTSKEYTCYYTRCLDQHLSPAIEIMSDIYCGSLLLETELDKEKSVVLEEISMYEDNPDELAHDLIFKALWGDHPLGTNAIGERDTIRALRRDDLTAYMDKWYQPSNLTVAAVGNMPHAELVQLIDEHLGGLSGEHIRPQFTLPEPRGDVLAIERDTEQVHLCIAVPGASRVDPLRYSVSVLDMLLGGSMSSRLFQELREERGLVYSTYSYNTCYSDAGLFGVYAGMSREHLEQVVELILEQIRQVRGGNVSESEIARAKEQLKANLVISLESMGNRMSRLAKLALFHERLVAPDEVMRQIDSVTLSHVVETAQIVLDPSRLAASAVGPIDSSLRGCFTRQCDSMRRG
jgi:predicted Zn-dependent peptidase